MDELRAQLEYPLDSVSLSVLQTAIAAILAAGSGISITNKRGTITIAVTTPGGVTSIIAGTGISVNRATGAVTVTNTQTSAVWGSITGTLTSQTDLVNKFALYLLLTGGKVSGTLTVSGKFQLPVGTNLYT